MFCQITVNRVKLRRAITFIKYLANVVFLLSLPKALSRNIIAFWLSNSLNPRELEVSEFVKSTSKKKQYLIGKKSRQKKTNFLPTIFLPTIFFTDD